MKFNFHMYFERHTLPCACGSRFLSTARRRAWRLDEGGWLIECEACGAVVTDDDRLGKNS